MALAVLLSQLSVWVDAIASSTPKLDSIALMLFRHLYPRTTPTSCNSLYPMKYRTGSRDQCQRVQKVSCCIRKLSFKCLPYTGLLLNGTRGCANNVTHQHSIYSEGFPASYDMDVMESSSEGVSARFGEFAIIPSYSSRRLQCIPRFIARCRWHVRSRV